MIATILFLIGVLPLALIPIHIYKSTNSHCLHIWKRLAISSNAQRLVAKLIAIYIAFYHIILFSAFPSNKGIMISTFMLFFLLSTNRTLGLLTGIRRCNNAVLLSLALIIIAAAFYKPLLTTAITVAFTFTVACLMPSGRLNYSSYEDINKEDTDTFVAKYFS